MTPAQLAEYKRIRRTVRFRWFLLLCRVGAQLNARVSWRLGLAVFRFAWRTLPEHLRQVQS